MTMDDNGCEICKVREHAFVFRGKKMCSYCIVDRLRQALDAEQKAYRGAAAGRDAAISDLAAEREKVAALELNDDGLRRSIAKKAGFIKHIQAQRDAAIKRAPKCSVCGKPATCLGRYEGHGPWRWACDDCCGHGNEDGECRPISDVAEWMTTKLDAVIKRAEKAELTVDTWLSLEKEQMEAAAAELRVEVERLKSLDVMQGEWVRKSDYDDAKKHAQKWRAERDDLRACIEGAVGILAPYEQQLSLVGKPIAKALDRLRTGKGPDGDPDGN